MADNKIVTEVQLTGESQVTSAFGRLVAAARAAFSQMGSLASGAFGRIRSFSLDSSISSFFRLRNSIGQTLLSATGLTSAFNLMGLNLRQLGTVFASVFAVNKLAQTLDQYTQWTNRLSTISNKYRLVKGSAEEMRLTEEKLYYLAKDTNSSLNSTIALYQRLKNSTEKMRLSEDKLLKVIEVVNKAVAASGVTSEEAERGIIQFSQGLALGTLRGQDLKSVITQIPYLANVIARGMGKTTDQIQALGEEGKLTASAVINALLRQSREVDKTFAKIKPTISVTLGTLGDVFTRFVGRLDTLGDVSGRTRGALNTLIDAFEDGIRVLEGKQPNLKWVGEFSVAVTGLVTGLTTFKNLLVDGYNNLVILADKFAEWIGLGISGTDLLNSVLKGIGVIFGGLIIGSILLFTELGKFVKLASDIGLSWQLVGKLIQLALDAIAERITSKFTEAYDWVKNKTNETFGSIKDYIVSIWDSIVAAWQSGLEKISALVASYVQPIIDKFNQAADAIRSIFGLSGSGGSSGAGESGYASGGLVRGPGTGTSDSVRARLSRGEFVVQAAAVQRYGARLFAALNGMALSPQATRALVGNLVPSVPMPYGGFATGGLVTGDTGTQPFSLTIGGQTFDGMTIKNSTIKDMRAYAATSALRSAGRKPTWAGR